jgi:glycine oxidase
MKVLIIGSGLAGTCLAHCFLAKGIRFKIIDKGVNQSTRVAGGIINPLVFRRMTLSWRADEFMPATDAFYRKLGEQFKRTFQHPIAIRRLFASEQEAGYWLKKQHLPHYSDFMTTQTEADQSFPLPQNTFGTGLVKGASHIDAASYYQVHRDWFSEQGLLETGELDYTDIDPETATYKGERYDYIVFCEGKDGKTNPWFGHLPLQQTKGEILTIHAPAISQNELLNRKCFLLPVGNGNFRAGSNYDWDVNNVIPTEAARALIEENIASVTNESYEVVDHVAGVRPTTPDRRPLFGKHAGFPKLVIANGLGAKGYMLAPLLMQELTDYLLEGKPLHPESDIARFSKH